MPNMPPAREIKDIADVVACVIDRGTFFPVAERLARGFKKVYYHHPSGESFDTVAHYSMGDGHPGVHFIGDFWKVKNEIDVFVFPDCKDDGLQAELESQGFPVWGSKSAGEIEQMRGKWLKECKDLNLPMPKTETVIGLINLRDYLKEHEGEKLFVKISRFRGDMETWETKNRHQVSNKLAYLAMRFGPIGERMTFYVQQPVETKIESGSDTYNIHGAYPDEIILGYEKKGESYFATVKNRANMPKEVWSCNEAIAPLLAEIGYANAISSEVRVTEDSESFWLDPCFRMPSPAGEEQLEMYANFPMIVYRGAMGELIQPEWAAHFCGEAVISYCGDRDAWKSIVVPEEIRRWVKLYACVYDDGAFHFPPAQDPEAIGCAVGLGDSPTEVLDHLKEIQEALKDEPVELHIEPMADLFTEIETAEKQGIEFSDQPVPEPAEVLE
jgi:hypothetical protein